MSGNALGRDYLGERKNEAELNEAAQSFGVNAKSEMWKLPAHFVGAYAEQDASLTLKLWKRFHTEMAKEDINDIFTLETNVLQVVLAMRKQGVRVDLEKAEVLKDRLEKQEQEVLASVGGQDIDIWAAQSIAKAFDEVGLKYPRTQKIDAPSFTKNFLSNHPHKIVQAIAKAREINKAHTTFIDTILKHSHKGRIHAEINQLRNAGGGTVTGRFSYQTPNLQQIPARNKDLGPKIRSLFIPEEGHTWGCFDYSQQEPRLVVHYASLYKLPSVYDVIDAYQNDSNSDFHQTVADMAEIPRSQAKTINLGLFYGMGKAKLQAELGVTKEKAAELFNTYHSRVPFVKQLMEKASNRAQDRGQIRTLLGRLCRFHLWEPNSFGMHKAMTHEDALREHGPGIKRAYTYKALNKLIQGSAADMTKKAMLELYKEGIIPHIQIHDQLDISVRDESHAKKIIDVMENAVTLEVPNKVDYEHGDNWGEIHG